MTHHISNTHHHAAHSFRRALVVLIGIALISIGGVWVYVSSGQLLQGTWKHPAGYLTFSAATPNQLSFISKDCTGYPTNKQGDFTLIFQREGKELVFPELHARQHYLLNPITHGLTIYDPGPLPSGSYSLESTSGFTPIGICGLQP